MVCSEVYGILPCSEGVVGSIFLLLVYGFIILQGARWISEGSELLLKVIDPGLIGGLLLPIVGALPDTFIVAASGLGGSPSEAQDKVEIGLGALAGANVMLLTIVIGVSIIVGRCDLDSHGSAVDKRLTRGWDAKRTGVTVDGLIKEGAIFMVVSAMLLLVPQLPAYWGTRTQGEVTLAGMVLCFVILVAYVVWQTIAPALQKRRMRAARHKLLKLYAVRTAHRLGGGGNIDDESLRRIFRQFDRGGDGHLDGSELKALVTGMTFGATGLVTMEYDADFWLKNFSKDPESRAISEEDFVKGMKEWISQHRDIHKRSRSMHVLLRRVTRDSGHHTPSDPALVPGDSQHPESGPSAITQEQMSSHVAAREEIDRALQAASVVSDDDSSSSSSDSDDDEDRGPPVMPSKRRVVTWGAFLILAGCVVIGVASDPLVDALDSFSRASGVPQFFVSFVIAPLASNAQEAVSCFLIARRRRRSHITLALAQVYGAVTLNNSMALGVFLAIVHFRKLRWTFDSEVTVILAVCLGVGILGVRRTSYPLWVAYVLLSIYPLAIALTAILDYGAGWGKL
ncbi:sodium/calcium exchanger family protein [Klebsormidium nitens]|uniref:Sodium/calcium exchanger family protein n=1 Tax=Klebsormidium nitens TaxID=105231 RepID=A0A1Y1IP36_KLENI|nr:sodium/calcium exchanger family protein [Klebsormidium nitens]|eukprot:GAQ92665.1 sodium/calcium exchanger family protein [Klebsormidium nitens]